MIGIIIVSHGKFSEGIVNTMEMIIGKQPNIHQLILNEGVSPDVLFIDYQTAIKKVNSGDGVLILTDLFGGTPSNVAARMALETSNIEIITGVNLPMLLEVVLARKKSISVTALADIALNSGQKGIKNIRTWINEQMTKS